MSYETFDVGDEITLRAAFATDPTSVDVHVEKPDGTTEVLTPTSPETGVYVSSVVPALGEHGTWWWAAHGTGNVQARGERKFRVRKPQVS